MNLVYILSNAIQLLSAIGLYSIFNGGCNYILNKKNNHRIAINLDKIDTINLPSIKSECNINEIKCLVKSMKINFDKNYLSNLYQNIKKLKIVKPNFKYSIMKGSYSYNKNIIKVNDETALPHEFFHMCSTSSSKNNIQGGFSIIQENFKFGYGLNEGYTELLARRYFKAKPHKSYNSQVKVAFLIESLFSSQREMEELYLTNALKGLIKKLCDYMSYENAINIINKIDMAHSLKIQGCVFANNVFSDIESSLTEYNNKKDDIKSNLTK